MDRVHLSNENHRQLWIPPGFAHGFLVLSNEADFYIKRRTIIHTQMSAAFYGMILHCPFSGPRIVSPF